PLSGARVTLHEIWRQEWKRTRRAVKALPRDPSDDELHAIRIRVKRARYAAELAAHELGKPGAAFVDAAKDVQDVLGEHQDASVAEERIVAWAVGRPEVADAAGRLVELERGRRAEMRAAWPGAWKALRRAAEPLR
ncbi:MAG: CHAD domain-containing protein, partial [Gaiella sp.]